MSNEDQAVFTVSISEQSTGEDFHIQVKRIYTHCLFDSGAFISCISYHNYNSFAENYKIQQKRHAKVTWVDGSNLKPLGMVYSLIEIGS